MESWGRQTVLSWSWSGSHNYSVQIADIACLPERCCSRSCSAKVSSSTPSFAHLNLYAAPDVMSLALSWEPQSSRPHVPTPLISTAGTTVTIKRKAAGFVSLMMQLGSLNCSGISFFFRTKSTRRKMFRKKVFLHKQGYFSWSWLLGDSRLQWEGLTKLCG